MKFTRIHVNSLILAVILAILQGAILWIVNGDIGEMIGAKDLGALAIVFSPTAGIVWALKSFSSKDTPD